MVIFDERNVQVILEDGKYYVRTDLGHFNENYVSIEISKEDAEKVMQDVMYTSKLVWDYQNKLWGLV
jgi:translation elongation factor P/translation initiation factor 5A